jgi:hypothetical protein
MVEWQTCEGEVGEGKKKSESQWADGQNAVFHGTRAKQFQSNICAGFHCHWYCQVLAIGVLYSSIEKKMELNGETAGTCTVMIIFVQFPNYLQALKFSRQANCAHSLHKCVHQILRRHMVVVPHSFLRELDDVQPFLIYRNRCT